MFGEYAQVASFINQDDRSYAGRGGGNVTYLPAYLLPMFNITNPWHTGLDNSQDDFIIIAEFSEIEGPKPLMTIPRDGGSGFDKNSFSVKIMAVDHQTSTSGFSLSEDTQVILTDSGEFNVSAFVHHFALYDNEARGFVRPFCMAYVTKEESKLINFYDDLSTSFKKVARFFKYGNKMVFVKDLEHHSSDLEYTKSCLIVKYRKYAESSEDSSVNDDRKYQDLHNIQTTLEEIRDILIILKPLLNDKRLENRFYTLEKRAWYDWNKPDKPDNISLQEHWFTDHTGNSSAHYGSFHEKNENPLHLFNREKVYIPKLVETKRKKKFDRTLRSLHELCSWGAKEGMKKLRCIYEHFKREAMVLELENDESSLLDPPSSVLSIGQCVTHNFLSNVSLRPADCPNFPYGSKPIDLVQRWASLDTLESSIDSFKSVVSMDSLQSAHSSDGFLIATDRLSEDDGSEKINAVTTTVPRTDSTFSFSSSQTDTDTMASVYESCPNSPAKTPDKIITTQELFNTGGDGLSIRDKSDTLDCISEIEDSGIHSENQNTTQDFVDTVETSLCDNSKDNSVIPCSQSVLTESSSVVVMNEPSSTLVQTVSCASGISAGSMSPVPNSCIPSSVSSSTVVPHVSNSSILPSNAPILTTVVSSPVLNVGSKPSALPVLTGSLSSPELPIISGSSAVPKTQPSTIYEDNQGKTDMNIGSSSGKLDITLDIPQTLSRQYSEPDDTTDTTLSSNDGVKTFQIPRKPRSGVYTIGDLLFNLRQGSPGVGILHILNKYSNLQYIIYSILTGRIVLVLGTIKQETEVIKLINALSLFLPQHRRKHTSILEWSSKPLRIHDLSRIKLAGVCKSEKRSVDSNVKKYCTIIDLEKRVIIAPNYQGVLINYLISKKKNFRTDGDFIAFTHCWLMEIASKVFIFYHSICLGSTNIISHNSCLFSYKQQYCNSVKGFLAKLGINESDSPIIEYLTEIVKLIQLNHQQVENGSSVLPVTLSYKPCQLYRC